MNTHAEKTQENKNKTLTNSKTQKKQNNSQPTFQFADNRPESMMQRKLNEISNNNRIKQPAQLKFIVNSHSINTIQKQGMEEEELLQGKFETFQKQGIGEEEPLQGKFESIQKQGLEEEELLQGKFDPIQMKMPEEEELLQGKFESIQKKENNTGLPDNLKSGIENLSGYSLDDVNVNFNSDKPAHLNAHAYAQGTDIHVAPGQEKHLPHEAWHVVQQKQGRVKPTMQMKGNVNVNDDAGLEKEADVMGEKALSTTTQFKEELAQRQATNSDVIQNFDAGIGAGWHIHFGEHIKYASNNATRVNFGGRTRQQVGYALEQKIQENGLVATKENDDFISCKTWIRNNIA